MMTAEELAEGLRKLLALYGPSSYQARVVATLEWVRDSGTAEGWPRWLVAMVGDQVFAEIQAGRFPLIEPPEETQKTPE